MKNWTRHYNADGVHALWSYSDSHEVLQHVRCDENGWIDVGVLLPELKDAHEWYCNTISAYVTATDGVDVFQCRLLQATKHAPSWSVKADIKLWQPQPMVAKS